MTSTSGLERVADAVDPIGERLADSPLRDLVDRPALPAVLGQAVRLVGHALVDAAAGPVIRSRDGRPPACPGLDRPLQGQVVVAVQPGGDLRRGEEALGHRSEHPRPTTVTVRVPGDSGRIADLVTIRWTVAARRRCIAGTWPRPDASFPSMTTWLRTPHGFRPWSVHHVHGSAVWASSPHQRTRSRLCHIRYTCAAIIQSRRGTWAYDPAPTDPLGHGGNAKFDEESTCLTMSRRSLSLPAAPTTRSPSSAVAMCGPAKAGRPAKNTLVTPLG